METNEQPETVVELIEGVQYDRALKNNHLITNKEKGCLLYTSPSPRDRQKSRMPSSA